MMATAATTMEEATTAAREQMTHAVASSREESKPFSHEEKEEGLQSASLEGKQEEATPQPQDMPETPSTAAVALKLKSAYCAGFIIFSPDHQRVALVLEDKGYYGFPKGKQQLWERLDMTARRELEEETGLLVSDIEWHPMLHVDENHRNGVIVRLWVARLLGLSRAPLPPLRTRKNDSVESVQWMLVEEAFKLPASSLSKPRKRCLRRALKLLKYLR